jgi:uncharacterized protein YjbI with pentapeptide repeats
VAQSRSGYPYCYALILSSPPDAGCFGAYGWTLAKALRQWCAAGVIFTARIVVHLLLPDSVKTRRKTSLPRKPDHFPAENVFERWDAAQLLRHGREFEQCRFISADFAGANLGNLVFIDCLFERCNMSSATLGGTSLQNVAFDACKLSGVQFTACRDMLFGVHFDQCQMPYTSFYGRKMPQTRFQGCALTDADFGSADLTEAVFQDCSLVGAMFERTLLNGADFTTATGFAIDPETNPLRKARFTLAGLPGLVGKYGVVIES